LLKVELRNLQRKVSLNKKRLKKITERSALKLEIKEGDLSVVFVGLNRMKKLNLVYRKRKEPTDVLSFLLDERPFSGEVVICPEAIRDRHNQMFKGGEMEKEISRRIVHGLLHLCHFDHQTEAEARVMKAKENELLKAVLTKE